MLRLQAEQGEFAAANVCDSLWLQNGDFGQDQCVTGECARLNRAFHQGTCENAGEPGRCIRDFPCKRNCMERSRAILDAPCVPQRFVFWRENCS